MQQIIISRGSQRLGKDPATKSDEFLEKCQIRGGGSFSIQKFILQILDLFLVSY